MNERCLENTVDCFDTQISLLLLVLLRIVEWTGKIF